MFSSPTILLSSRSRCFFHIAADSSESLMILAWGEICGNVRTKQSEKVAFYINNVFKVELH